MIFGLSTEDYQMILNLAVIPLQKQGARVWIFGSRARGDHRPFSDIDILYSLSKDLPPGYLAQIIEDLEESRLPIKVDLVRDIDMAKSYRDNVLKDCVEILEPLPR